MTPGYPSTSGLAAWSLVFSGLLEAAREQLTELEHATLLDIVTARVARENALVLERET